MTPEHWQHIKSLLHSALERDPVERAAFLNQACGGDFPLRKEVESLIESHERADSFIETPAFEVMAESIENSVRESLVGDTLGHYHVVRQLGAGGMGDVYLAEETKLGRKVALKMLPARFTSDDERVRRFQQEARAASALNHPNILTIYEIGQTDSRHFIGDKDKALDWIERAYDERSVAATALLVDTRFNTLRSQPRYQAVLSRMGLAPSADSKLVSAKTQRR